MSSTAVARRYAGALAEVAAARSALDTVGQDLTRIGDLLEGQPELSAALSSPAFSPDERRRVLGAVLARFSLHPLAANFLRVLADNRRLAEFAGIAEAYRAMQDEQVGRVRATVTSAAPLDAPTVAAIRAQVARLTDAREVVITERVDPALIGGVVTRVGDLVLDGSLRTRLNNLRLSLVRREAAEA